MVHYAFVGDTDRPVCANHTSSSPLFPSAGAQINFRLRSDSGALLINGPAAHSREIKARRHIEVYMRKHFASWVEFANAHGLGLRDEDLYFVYGTTKTSNWAVAAFNGNYKHNSGTITANFGSLAGDVGIDFSLSITNQNMSSCWHRTGRSQSTPLRPTSLPNTADLPSPPLSPALTPPPLPAYLDPAVIANESRLPDSSSHLVPTEQLLTPPSSFEPQVDTASSLHRRSLEGDQCIFMRYFKMKRRKFLPLRPIKAAAGPHEVPRPGPEDDDVMMGWDDDVSDDEDEIESVPGLEKVSV